MTNGSNNVRRRIKKEGVIISMVLLGVLGVFFWGDVLEGVVER